MARKVFKYIIVAVIAVNLVIFLWVLLNPATPRVPLPNPNGYDDFVKAGQSVNLGTNDYTHMSRDELAALIATNAEALKLVRTGLGRESRMPDDYSANYVAVSLVSQLAAFKELWRLFGAEGRLAELEGRTNDAAKIYLEGIRFGQACSRGGLFLSRLVGVACEKAALSPLETLRDGLTTTDCRTVARSLEAMDASEETVSETLEQEQSWARRTYGLKGRIEALLTRKQMKASQDAVVAKLQANTLRIRQAMLAFAARAYELEKGKHPQSVADLVPEYLKAVPKDPATGKDLSLLGR